MPRKWDLPENLLGVGICILGLPNESPAARPRKQVPVVGIPYTPESVLQRLILL